MNKHRHDCSCDTHHHHEGDWKANALISVGLIAAALVLLRPVFVAQMHVRVASYASFGMQNDVQRMCRKIIMFDPQNFHAWTALGISFADTGRKHEAVAALERAVELRPDDQGAASYYLGKTYFELGSFAQALACFSRISALGQRASAMLDKDILTYRHGPQSLRYLHQYDKLLAMQRDAVRK